MLSRKSEDISTTKDTKRTKELEGETFDSIPQPPDVEVDEQSNPYPGKQRAEGEIAESREH